MAVYLQYSLPLPRIIWSKSSLFCMYGLVVSPFLCYVLYPHLSEQQFRISTNVNFAPVMQHTHLLSRGNKKPVVLWFLNSVRQSNEKNCLFAVETVQSRVHQVSPSSGKLNLSNTEATLLSNRWSSARKSADTVFQPM